MMNNIPNEVSRVTSELEKAGFDAYLVGGCVRDLLLGKEPRDWDITTNALPDQIISLFSKTFYENSFGTVTIINEAGGATIREIQVTPYRLEGKYSDFRHPDQISFAKTLEEDLGRRDFTINAVAYSVPKGQLIDLYAGQQDLAWRSIRAVGNPTDRFREDPLRILRAIRLATELGFTINTETANAITEQSVLLQKISAERIRDEFGKIIMSKQPMVGLILSHKLGILGQFLPELAEGIGMKQNGDHKYDVWEHTLRVLQHSADKNFEFHVRLAALFHDIGKPKTRKWGEEKGDWTFYGHDVVGAKMARKAMGRLKFSSKIVETVEKLVRNHMFFTDIEKITLSAVRRIIRNVGQELVWDLMKVRNCDRIGMGRPKESPYRLRKYESMIEEALRSPTSVAMLKINGARIIEVTKTPPGPKIGQILHALLEEVLDKPELNTVETLEMRAKELANLPDQELQKLGEAGKEKKEAVEEGELKKIRQKYAVK
ncbi:MAG: HD domain-containing protein [Patescibacteria group bacterium]